MARISSLEVRLEAERTNAHLSEDKAELDREHQAILEEIEAVQNELRLSDRICQIYLIDMHKGKTGKPPR